MKVKFMSRAQLNEIAYSVFRSIWLFPLFVLALIIILSCLGISGSSVGIYNGSLNSKGSRESGIISFKPQPVRSDEWLVNTQMTVAQASAGYPMINNNIGEGQDMSLILDVPYKDWSLLFKPQNIIFLIAPLNFAFAFKWWFLGGLLAVSSYLFFLRLVPNKRFAAACFGTILFFTPMVQWWYQSITIMPLAIGFLILTLLVTIHQTDSFRRRLIMMLCLSYLIVVFGLIMYPPFQIPIVLVVIAFYIAYVVGQWLKIKSKRVSLLRNSGLVLAASLLSLLIMGIFLLQHSSTIHSIFNTAYPGKRDVLPGDYPAGNPFTGQLSVFLQASGAPQTYKELYPTGTNQSESSNFIIPAVFFLIISTILIAGYRRKLDTLSLFALWGLSIICLLFYLNIYLPFGHAFYKLITLTLVPHTRLLIGLGFLSVLLLAIIVRVSDSRKFIMKRKPALVVFLITGFLSLLLTYIFNLRNPGYVTSYSLAVIVSLAIPLSLFFLSRARINLALLTLALLSILSSVKVNPLNRNLDEITDTKFSQYIKTVRDSDKSARWVTNSVMLENYAVANGVKSLSGVYTYPQIGLWRKLDPNRKYENIYNRYAHVSYTFNDAQSNAQFSLRTEDNLIITISPCNSFFTEQKAVYFYSTKPIVSKCLHLARNIHESRSATTVFVYKKT